MVEARIAQEQERAEAYLDVATTSAKLLRIVDDVFVSQQVRTARCMQLLHLCEIHLQSSSHLTLCC